MGMSTAEQSITVLRTAAEDTAAIKILYTDISNERKGTGNDNYRGKF